MEPADRDLQNRLKAFCDALVDAENYVVKYKPVKLPTIRQLSREAFYAHRASQRRLCLGLFGPSQAGKSFLIGDLGRGAEETLRVSPSGSADQAVSFLDHMNPNKGNEATGVVCRFTTQPQMIPERSNTFVARLLSQADLIKCLATGFVYECDFFDTEGLHQRIDDIFEQLPTGDGTDPFVKVLDDAWQYVEKTFASHPYFAPFISKNNLEKNIRRRLGDVGRISPSQRITLASMFWGTGELPSIDKLYRHLSQTLDSLKNSEHIEIDRDAIVAEAVDPKQPASLVQDSAILIDIMTGARGNTNVYFGTDAQESASIEKATASALLAELSLPVYLQLSSENQHILNHADILDFPGARAGKAGGGNGINKDQLAGEVARNEPLIEILKRGKLTYLFDGYCAEREINVLAFCVDTIQNFECAQAPRQVERWIKTRYPRFDKLQQAELELPSLFLCLTKFDRRIVKSKGVGVEERWATAIEKVLSIFGARHGASASLTDTQLDMIPVSDTTVHPNKMPWITNWGAQPDRCFDNIYWVRNPDFPEHGINPKVVEDYKKQYEQCELIVKFVGDHREKWLAATPQSVDGKDLEHTGVQLLAQNIVKKLLPEIKRHELTDQLTVLISQLLENLPEYMSGPADLEKQQENARQEARKMIDLMRRHEKDCEFGPLLQTLNLPADIVQDQLDSIAIDVVPVLMDQQIDEFIDSITDKWLQQVENALADTVGVAKILHENSSAIDFFAEQLAIRARSPEFRDEFKQSISFFFENARGIDSFRQPLTAICCRKWSDLVVGLGYKIEPQENPTLPPKLTGNVPWSRYMTHWDTGMEKLYIENCSSDAAVPKGNDELGKVLQQVEAVKSQN